MSPDVRPEDQRIDMGALVGAVLSRWLRIFILTAVVLGVTFAVLLFVPKMYDSTAGLLVEQRANLANSSSATGTSQPSIPVEAMMSSQIELIRSRDTLLAVIDSQNLRSESEFTGIGLSPVTLVMQLIGRAPEPRSIDEAVLANLLDRLSVVRERDSAVISVNVRSRDPELAARIANAIAEAHVRRRTALSLSDTAEASEWLEQEIARLRVRVQQADEAVATYRIDNDLFFVGANDTSLLDQQLSAVSAQISAAQERKNTAQSRASLIRELVAAGQPIDAVQDVRNSVVIQQLSQNKANLQGELAQRSSTLLPNHPTVRALAAQIAEVEQQITAEARRVANALEAEARIEADLEQSLRDEMALMKLTVSDATRDTVTLDGLQREAKAQRDLLESYLLRYSDAISRTDAGSALPDVRQITIAAPAATPASPKTTFILAAVGFVALALQIGGVLFGELMSGRAIMDGNSFRQVREDEEDFEEGAPRGYHPVDIEMPEEHENQEPDDGYEREVEFDHLDFDLGPDEHGEPAPMDPALEDMLAEREVAAMAPPADMLRPGPRPPTRPNTSIGDEALELSNLSADIALGRVRVVMLASLGEPDDCESVAEALIADALRRGLSVVQIDAGSGRVSAEPGLTDLSRDLASFGDVVHRVREGLAEVPWGHEAALERRSMRPNTLVEALTDIYEVVIVMTGRIGLSSALPVFSGIPCRLVLVGDAAPDRAMLAAAIEDAANLGFEVGQIVRSPQRQTEVA